MRYLAYAYGLLAVAVVFETIATTFLLRSSAGFTVLWPTVGTIVLYLAAFLIFAASLKRIPVGIAYALWSAFGIAFITAIGTFVFGQPLDLPAVTGLALIVAGIAVISLFSKTNRV